MSDVSPGHGWWQATDGRWYPPELRPTSHLVRHSTGATVLVPADEVTDTAGATPAPAYADAGNVEPHSHEAVGGAIDSHTELYLGRPAGLQNRPAAWVALIGAMIMVGGGLLPWSVRESVAGTAELGWRDAGGELGGGLYIALLAVTVMTISVRCMAGSFSRGWRASLVVLATGALAMTIVEAVRIQQAIAEVTELSRGNVSLSFGPGLLVVGLGAGVVLMAAGAYRVGSPH